MEELRIVEFQVLGQGLACWVWRFSDSIFFFLRDRVKGLGRRCLGNVGLGFRPQHLLSKSLSAAGANLSSRKRQALNPQTRGLKPKLLNPNPKP